ncbi:MAG: hypothetical protein H6745_22430 [Deltaproteobacteria bacterium]|nr:hypothetical protein [Deltaproteobacteria bacterium]
MKLTTAALVALLAAPVSSAGCVDLDVDAERVGGEAPAPCAEVAPERLDLRADLGEIVVGTVTVTNCGEGELFVEATVEDDGRSGVLVDGEPKSPVALLSGWQVALHVRAAPRVVGVASARVVVAPRGLDEVVVPVTITTTAPGTAP